MRRSTSRRWRGGLRQLADVAHAGRELSSMQGRDIPVADIAVASRATALATCDESDASSAEGPLYCTAEAALLPALSRMFTSGAANRSYSSAHRVVSAPNILRARDMRESWRVQNIQPGCYGGADADVCERCRNRTRGTVASSARGTIPRNIRCTAFPAESIWRESPNRSSEVARLKELITAPSTEISASLVAREPSVHRVILSTLRCET